MLLGDILAYPLNSFLPIKFISAVWLFLQFLMSTMCDGPPYRWSHDLSGYPYGDALASPSIPETDQTRYMMLKTLQYEYQKHKSMINL